MKLSRSLRASLSLSLKVGEHAIDVFASVFRAEGTALEAEVDARVHGLVRHSVQFLPLVDAHLGVPLRDRYASRIDGLPRAGATVLLHWLLVAALNAPLVVASAAHAYNATDAHAACAFADLLSGACAPPWRLPTVALGAFVVADLCFFHMYVTVEYLCRQIDSVLLDDAAERTITRARRRLLRLRASAAFGAPLAALVGALWLAAWAAATAFALFSQRLQASRLSAWLRSAHAS